MTRQQAILLGGTLVLVSAAAYVMRDEIHEMVIVPLAYLWWLVGLYYHLIPQVFVWVLLITIILFSSVKALLMEIPLGKNMKYPSRVQEGPVENLAMLVEKRRRGVYYKWLMANRLGKVARELLDQREGERAARRFTRLTGRDWTPPLEIESYLESGLNGSFADYPQSSWSGPRSTPLDAHPLQVVEYLESEMENNRNGHP